MKNIVIILTLIFSFLLVGCDVQNKKTTLKVENNDRHYYPVHRGQEMDIVFSVKNVGEAPFILKDIFTSCSCLEVSKKSSIKSIPAGRKGVVWLKYNTQSNIGYVKQYVTLYGNLENKSKQEIKFDLNIVPDADYTKDYEDLYKSKANKKARIKDLVNGRKRYYLDPQ